MAKITVLFFSLAMLSACTTQSPKGMKPQQILTEYISRSFLIKQNSDRAGLAYFLTGDLKSRLNSWSDDQFRDAFIETKRKFIKLSFKDEKKVSDTEIALTYELTFLDETKKPSTKVTQKKLARIVFEEQERWLIADVRNIKELIEYQGELAFP